MIANKKTAQQSHFDCVVSVIKKSTMKVSLLGMFASGFWKPFSLRLVSSAYYPY
jgi:hypothetical protein